MKVKTHGPDGVTIDDQADNILNDDGLPMSFFMNRGRDLRNYPRLSLRGALTPRSQLYSDYIVNASYPRGLGSWQLDENGGWVYIADDAAQVAAGAETSADYVAYPTGVANAGQMPGESQSWFDKLMQGDNLKNLVVGLTALQLSQVNIERAKQGLPPLTQGQTLGVAGAPPAITPGILLAGAGILALVLLRK